MNAEQKRAWLGVGSGIACLISFLILVPFVGPHRATAALAFLAVNGFVPLIRRRDKLDERDMSISNHATLAGGMASYTVFVLGCMGVWFVAFAWQGQTQVSVHLMGIITAVGGAVFYFVRGVAVLIFYGRHEETDHA